MSRIGNQPIPLKKAVKVEVAGKHVTVTGPKATLEMDLPELISAQTENGKLVVNRDNDSRDAKSRHGLCRTLINNMIIGVETGFKKELEIRGVGYRAEMKGTKMVLSLGFSHPVEYNIPKGVNVEIDAKRNIVTLTGADKHKVGQVAAEIRAIKKPDVYKGKGIRYVGEYVIQKEGKTV